jgi:hypothetical protein
VEAIAVGGSLLHHADHVPSVSDNSDLSVMVYVCEFLCGHSDFDDARAYQGRETAPG